MSYQVHAFVYILYLFIIVVLLLSCVCSRVFYICVELYSKWQQWWWWWSYNGHVIFIDMFYQFSSLSIDFMRVLLSLHVFDCESFAKDTKVYCDFRYFYIFSNKLWWSWFKSPSQMIIIRFFSFVLNLSVLWCKNS